METRIDPAVLSIAEPITREPYTFGIVEYDYMSSPNVYDINIITAELRAAVFHDLTIDRDSGVWIIASRRLNEVEQRIAYNAWKSARHDSATSTAEPMDDASNAVRTMEGAVVGTVYPVNFGFNQRGGGRWAVPRGEGILPY